MGEHIPRLSGELLEVVDEAGVPTGLVEDKTVIHARQLLHRVVHVWGTDGENLLQQRRGDETMIMPECWDTSASGHVGLRESYIDAAVREALEEMGLELRPDQLEPFGVFQVDEPVENNPIIHHRVIGENFAVLKRNLSLDALRLARGEVFGARWYPIDQLEQDLRDPVAAREHAPHPPAMYAAGIAAMRAMTEVD